MAVGLSLESGSHDHEHCGVGKGFTQCLDKAESVKTGGAGGMWPVLEVTKTNWIDAVHAVHVTEVGAVTPVLECLRLMSLCPTSIMSALSGSALRCYAATEGLGRIQTPGQFLSQTAWFVHAVEAIRSEIEIYKKIKEAEDHGR